MNANRIFYRKTMLLDNRVLLTIIITMVLSLGLLSFFVIDRNKCTPFTFMITPSTDSNIYYTGKTLYFDASISAKNMVWDFDDSTEGGNGLSPHHIFSKAGKYTITASINSNCDASRDITVLRNPDDLNGNEIIRGPDNILAGKETEFTCFKNANTYEWVIVNHTGIIKLVKGPSAKMNFPNGGPYTIQVTLNGDRLKYYQKDIVVIGNTTQPKATVIPKQLIAPEPKPLIETEPVKEKTITLIAESTFKNKLITVLNDGSTKLTVDGFDQYLFYGVNTKVYLSNGEQPMTFGAFYNMIIGKHNNLNIENVELKKDADGKIYRINVRLSYN